MLKPALWMLAAMPCSACYVGTDDLPPTPGAEQADAGEPADGSEDDSSSEEGEPACEPGSLDVGPSQMARLTRVEYDNAARALLGEQALIDSGRLALSDGHQGPFAHNAGKPVAQETVEDYQSLAETLADWAARQLDTLELVECELADPDCAEQFIADLGRRAYRRPLDEAERERLWSVFEVGAEVDMTDGYRLVIATLLQSPHFLYRVELGTPTEDPELYALSSLEMASRLSFALWKAPPDEALLAAAEAGELSDADGVEDHARRLLDDPRAQQVLVSFHTEWLGIEQAQTLERDPVFESFDPQLWEQMREQARRLTDDILDQGDARLETLLTARHTFVTPELAEAIYGIEGAGGNEAPAEGWERIELDPDRWAGLLTTPAFMAVTAHADQTSPVLRGLAVRERLLCTTPPPPPSDAADTPPEVDPSLPTRERFDEHRSNPECAGCHQLMDPLGYAFESYDPIGRFRTEDAGHPVDPSGEVVGTRDADGPFENAVELVERLSTSEDVQRCVQTQMFRFANGRSPAESDRCAAEAVFEAFVDSDYDVRELLLALVTSDAFRHRRVATQETNDDSH